MSEYSALLKDYAVLDKRSFADKLEQGRQPGFVKKPGLVKNRTPKAAKALRTIKLLSAIILLLAGIGLVTGFLVLPAFVVENVSYGGLSYLKPEDLAPYNNLKTQSYSFMLDRHAIENSVEQHPGVEKAVLSMQFPNRVQINITERKAVAIVYARTASGRLEAHCVDKNGVVFASASGQKGASSLPVLSGLEIRGLRYGMSLGPAFKDVLESLGELSQSDPSLLYSISELRLQVSGKQANELLLYPVACPVPVRLQPALNSSILRIMLLILDVISEEGLAPSISELDLRTNTYIYRTKEAVSG
ncbi:FtsQ-type POTRA domain-containing protein [Spirochaetota bacterium]